MKKKIPILLVVSLLLVLIFAPVVSRMDSGSIAAVEAAAVKLNTKKVTLLKNKTKTIKLSGTKKKAVWKTSKKSVVKIVTKKDRLVKIKAVKAGTAVISAKLGKKTYQCKVTVVDPKLDKTKITLKIGEKANLKVKGGTGTITWKSSNPSIASIKNGTITAKKAGTAKVTVTRNNKSLTCNVIVNYRTKKVWVVTKEAWIEYKPVYEYTYYYECTGCNAIFNMETEEDEYDAHERKHLLNGENNGWRTKVDRVLLYVDEIEHPEEGYWETVYY